MIDFSNPAALIQSLGLPFFVFFLIGAGLTWWRTERVYLSIAAGLALGAIALLILGSTL
jgi:branched-subunit amino acid transport protein AzlD